MLGKLYEMANTFQVTINIQNNHTQGRTVVGAFFFGKQQTIHYKVMGTKENVVAFSNFFTKFCKKVQEAYTQVEETGVLVSRACHKTPKALEQVAMLGGVIIKVKTKSKPSSHFLSYRIHTITYTLSGAKRDVDKMKSFIAYKFVGLMDAPTTK